MIEIVFRGRLGNQLFQYAYASTLAARLGVRLGADVSWYLRAPEPFDLWRFAGTGYRPLTWTTHLTARIKERLLPLRGLRDYAMYDSRFEPEALAQGDGVRLNGWFQSVRYFQDDAKRIRATYDLAPFLPRAAFEGLRERAKGRPMAALHVRRGDYVGNPNFDLGDYDAYYRGALTAMDTALGTKPFLVVLSDDPDWCRTWPLIESYGREVFSNPGGDPLADLSVMAACDHNIIANSSFSWWGAWLGGPQGRCVVMPSRWYPDKTTDAVGMDVPGWVQV